MEEVWKEVQPAPGYKISSLGRFMKPDGTIQRGSLNAQGYHQFQIPAGNKKYRVLHGHKEVCRAFHGDKPFPNAQALHKNGVRHDNRPGNVYWGTHQQNMDDRDKDGTTARGETAGLAKLTWEQVREIRRLHRAGVSRPRLYTQFNIGRSTLQSILSNKTWVE